MVFTRNPHFSFSREPLILCGLGVILALLGGCGSDGTPHMRLGSIPFPGPFTLYAVADPADLGEHRYEGGEHTSRGILYTTKAGFLDLSHLRESMDIVKYTHDQLTASLRSIQSGECRACEVQWSDCSYGLVFCAPDWWSTLDACERDSIIEEASILAAQRLAIDIGTWHEIGTWWGQETIPPFSEKNSALTWDDTTSHVVAAIVAGRALRDTQTPWNTAVTQHLSAMLTELGVVGPDCEAKAVEAVRGLWWSEGVPIRRDLDTGLAGNVKTPWLAPGLDCCPQESPAQLTLPELSDVRGRDLREAFHLRIKPESWLVRKALGCDDCPREITSERDILAAVEHLRASLKEEFGADADNPLAAPRTETARWRGDRFHH